MLPYVKCLYAKIRKKEKKGKKKKVLDVPKDKSLKVNQEIEWAYKLRELNLIVLEKPFNQN